MDSQKENQMYELCSKFTKIFSEIKTLKEQKTLIEEENNDL
jgi:hypothetical protein